MRRALLAFALLVPVAAAAQEVRLEGFRPHITGEVDMGLYAIDTLNGSAPRRQGTNAFAFGEIAAGLHLAPNFSIQGVLNTEPAGETEPNGGVTGFRYAAASVEALFAEWRPSETVMLYAGKFSAPFGRGHHDFPGVLTAIRAHEVYLIKESVGAGGSWTFLSDAVLGEHDLSVAVFGYDTSPLSNTLITRQRCCREGFERYRRNTRDQGGAGNTGQMDSVAVALDGDHFGWLPGLSYHASVLSRGAGRDGTAREWGVAGALRYDLAWTETLRTLVFAEAAAFRNAGGRPAEEIETGIDAAGDATYDTAGVGERRVFSTLGARTSWEGWRSTLAWQKDQRKRTANAVPTEDYVEWSVGRDIGWGFGVDVGWQYARYAREEGGRGQSNAAIGVLRWRQTF
ncbi:hypothetical protein C8P66_104193 [Humitalea rosea]|uniref:Porin n=1 Tax=Humitalea rosea TaxID=990373 RepID=A0A2W7IN83_9PROT|nr:hypothetical protein [Humitalea rosea]PZW48776.1 hypothetical protein C8P66_104193 [Humitalea rosea]